MRRPSIDARLRSFYRGRKVLVTGGASFIGSHLCELLVASGASVTAVDDLSSGKLAHLSSVRSRIRFKKGDLRREKTAVAAVRGQELVFHLAAAHGGRGYIESHPVECLNNMTLDHQVFAAATRAGVKKLVYASSACVYPLALQAESKSRALLKEADGGFDAPGKAHPDGEYGWAKLMGELQLRAFHKQSGISGIACRLFTAYGERENESHAVVALIAKAAARMDPYPIWGDGRQTRNFTYVRDTVVGLALAGARLDGFQTLNVGTSRHHTVLELLNEVFAATGWAPRKIVRERSRPVGVKSRAADNARSRRLLGWCASYPLSEGVRRTALWYQSPGIRKTGARLAKALMERA